MMKVPSREIDRRARRFECRVDLKGLLNVDRLFLLH